MATPKSVQRQLEAAEAIQQALVAEVEGNTTPVVTDLSQLQTQPVAEPAPAPTQPVAQQPAPTQPEVDWQQRFKTVKGMYDAEVPRLRAETKVMESELTALKEQVRALTAVASQKPAEQPKIDPKDAADFGEDMVAMVHRNAQQVYESLRQEFDQRISAIEQNLTGVSKKAEVSLENQFYATLTKLVPNWREVNVDERWLAWLAERDPTFGVPRQAALDQAFSAGDAERVGGVFEQFLASLPKKQPESLAAQAAPVSSGAPVAPVEMQQQQRQLLSQKFVQSFYNDLTRGRYAGREAEAEQIEQQINLAAAEGRIV